MRHAGAPKIAELWREAKGDKARMHELMIEHGLLVEISPEAAGEGPEAAKLRAYAQGLTERRRRATEARRAFWRESVAPVLRRMAARIRAGGGSWPPMVGP